MKPFVSDPGPAITLGQAVTRLPRRWPIAPGQSSLLPWR